MQPIPVIEEGELEVDGDMWLHNGLPFTGLARLLHLDGSIRRETAFKNGFEEGIIREWHPNGQLKHLSFMLEGRQQGRSSDWYDAGTRKSAGFYFESVELCYRQWARSGELTEDRYLSKASESWKHLADLAADPYKLLASEDDIRGQMLSCLFRSFRRPAKLDPCRATPAVRALAQTIHDDWSFDQMPILGDALEDSGCQDAQVLGHCRQPGEHVPGCWVLELLLGRSDGK